MSSARKNGSLITITLSVSAGMPRMDAIENAPPPRGDMAKRSRAKVTHALAARAAKHAFANLNRSTFPGNAGYTNQSIAKNAGYPGVRSSP